MGISFKLLTLVAIAGAYVLFELVLLAVEGKRKLAQPCKTTKLGLEAYRPVTSWTTRPE